MEEMEEVEEIWKMEEIWRVGCRGNHSTERSRVETSVLCPYPMNKGEQGGGH